MITCIGMEPAHIYIHALPAWIASQEVRALLPEKTWARGCYRIKRVCHGQNMMWAIPNASLAIPKVIIHGWYTPSPFMVGLSLGLTH